ncbi:MBL fold metallo-hydrolase [Halorientalis brevis]|uniref:MBL fold metallo-hydrolase n=1 Tax=Halorientalis brevis TaxID=1126241 RepID=A0ABD6C5G8_9EURY|nr:MBL fold metallo-hydrolase [Halorientalis brevis]
MFTRLSIPTPFQVGPVNAYLAGRTLVDPGPDSEEAWSRLLDALEEREIAPGDVERVLVTHPHPDHFGLAHRFSDRGATVVASPDAAAIVADFEGRFEYERTYFTDFFERCGMAGATAETVTDLPKAFLRYAPSVPIDREVTTDDSIVVQNTTLTVRETAGHAAGELLFRYATGDGQRAIVGDHVLADITPNPFLVPPPEPDADRPRVLPAYNRSLDRLRDQSFDRFLAGHRDPIDAPSDRIDEILAEHDERTENVAALVDGPTTPVDVMEGLFGDLPITEYFAGISEAVGHLDVLESRGEVVANDQGGVLVYERT